MEWDVVFDESRGAAIVSTRGKFNATDHARMVEDVVSRAQWRPGHPVMFDHRGLDFGAAGFATMSAARDTHMAHEARIGAARTAILMKSIADFGTGRQFQLLLDGAVSADVRVFVDEKAAWEWLAAKQDEA